SECLLKTCILVLQHHKLSAITYMQINSKKVFWLLFGLSTGTLSAKTPIWAPAIEVNPIVSQQHAITGRIIDQQGAPIAGATVSIPARSVTVLSDQNGTFTISGNLKDTLQVNYLGYTTVSLAIASLSDNEIVLAQAHQHIEEVLVSIGYQQVRKSDVTGAISSVQAEELNLSAPNLSQGMVGKVAGVQIMQTSGAPYDGAKMRVRGMGSINA